MTRQEKLDLIREVIEDADEEIGMILTEADAAETLADRILTALQLGDD